MRRTFLRAKIHRARVTRANLDYVGSITVDRDLLEAADLLGLEQVDIYNISTGARLSTYVLVGEPGSGEIGINGAAAHLASPGDVVIIAAYCELDRDEIPDHRARVVFVDDANRVVDVVEQTPFDQS